MAEPTAQASQPEALDRETLIVAGVVMLGAVMSILDTTVVNVAIDHLAVAFRSSLTTIQWVITGYTLALAAVIPVTGWAADRFGTVIRSSSFMVNFLDPQVGPRPGQALTASPRRFRTVLARG